MQLQASSDVGHGSGAKLFLSCYHITVPQAQLLVTALVSTLGASTEEQPWGLLQLHHVLNDENVVSPAAPHMFPRRRHMPDSAATYKYAVAVDACFGNVPGSMLQLQQQHSAAKMRPSKTPYKYSAIVPRCMNLAMSHADSGTTPPEVQ